MIVRVLTEALNNIDKHAGVRSADVAITAAEEIVMTIRDGGRGSIPRWRSAIRTGTWVCG